MVYIASESRHGLEVAKEVTLPRMFDQLCSNFDWESDDQELQWLLVIRN